MSNFKLLEIYIKQTMVLKMVKSIRGINIRNLINCKIRILIIRRNFKIRIFDIKLILLYIR